jgi:hypothetical protein
MVEILMMIRTSMSPEIIFEEGYWSLARTLSSIAACVEQGDVIGEAMDIFIHGSQVVRRLKTSEANFSQY